jgi:hypothetical protein
MEPWAGVRNDVAELNSVDFAQAADFSGINRRVAILSSNPSNS